MYYPHYTHTHTHTHTHTRSAQSSWLRLLWHTGVSGVHSWCVCGCGCVHAAGHTVDRNGSSVAPPAGVVRVMHWGVCEMVTGFSFVSVFIIVRFSSFPLSLYPFLCSVILLFISYRSSPPSPPPFLLQWESMSDWFAVL